MTTANQPSWGSISGMPNWYDKYGELATTCSTAPTKVTRQNKVAAPTRAIFVSKRGPAFRRQTTERASRPATAHTNHQLTKSCIGSPTLSVVSVLRCSSATVVAITTARSTAQVSVRPL